MTVKIITDSTCDLPKETIEKYDIRILPVNVIFDGKEVRRSYVDLSNEEFYTRLIAGAVVTTGVPGAKIFQDLLEETFKEADEVLFITISSKLSAVYQIAKMVAENHFKDKKLSVVDSLSATAELGLVVLLAARKLAEGFSREEVVKYLTEEIVPNVHLISYADDLKYLRRGGRISRLRHLMGRMLRIKPIFHIEDGLILAPGQIMLWQNIEDAMKKLLKKMAGQQTVETVYLAHSGNEEKCQMLVDYLKSLPNAPKEVLMTEVGPAVGVHVGPNTVGFVWVGGYSDDWFEDL